MKDIAKILFRYLCELAYLLAVHIRDGFKWIDQMLMFLVVRIGDLLVEPQNARILVLVLYAYIIWKFWKWYKKYPKEESESRPELERLLKTEKKTSVNKKKKGKLDMSLIFIVIVIIGILLLAYLAQKSGNVAGDNLLFPTEFVK